MVAHAEQWLDGNAAAGAPAEVFAIEITTAVATCEGCRRTSPIAGLMLCGGGVGLVLRCPGCEAAIIRFARTPGRFHLDLRGAALLRFAKLPGGTG